MEETLRAIALEELALHAFPGISFERLCANLREEHQLHLDRFVKVSSTPDGIVPLVVHQAPGCFNGHVLLLKMRGSSGVLRGLLLQIALHVLPVDAGRALAVSLP